MLLACTRWLEAISELPEEDQNLNTKHLLEVSANRPGMGMGIGGNNLSQDDTDVSGYEDFDAEEKIQSKAYREGEFKLLKAIFNHLRSGNLQDVQQKLNIRQCYDHLLMLNGTLPMFDNVKYK